MVGWPWLCDHGCATMVTWQFCLLCSGVSSSTLQAWTPLVCTRKFWSFCRIQLWAYDWASTPLRLMSLVFVHCAYLCYPINTLLVEVVLPLPDVRANGLGCQGPFFRWSRPFVCTGEGGGVDGQSSLLAMWCYEFLMCGICMMSDIPLCITVH